MLTATRLVQQLGFEAEPNAWMLGGRAVSFICGLLSVWVVWLFARDLYDQTVANIAAFVFAVLPLPRVLASDAQSDMMHTLLYLVAAWLACRAITSGRLLPLAGAGVASALAYWIRPEGLEVFLVTLVVLAWLGIHADWSWRRVVLAGATLAAAVLLVAAPYPLVSGKFTSKQLPFIKQQRAASFIEQLAEVAPPKHEPAPAAEVPPKVATPQAPPATADAPIPASLPIAPPPAVADNAPTLATPAPVPAEEPPPPEQPERHYTAGLVAWTFGTAIVSLVECTLHGFRYVFMPLYLLGQWEMFRRQTDKRLIALLWMLALLAHGPAGVGLLCLGLHL